MKTQVAVLPSLFTLGNLMCGFAAIGVSARAQLYWRAAQPEPGKAGAAFALAGGLVILAMALDGLDGIVARVANQTSAFGAELDSLCDMVSFGIAPGYIVFLEASSRNLFGHYWYAWVCAALYAVCTALRLARFNVETEPKSTPLGHFLGLPSPAAAGVIAGLAIFEWRMEIEAEWAARAMPFAAVVMGGLMISRFRYAHVLDLLFRQRHSFKHLVMLIFGLFTVFALPLHYEYVLLVGFSVYALSGPAGSAWRGLRRLFGGKPPSDDRPGEPPAS
jgi:CDP-diacylglycerol--serine O-phosphatidyltransferase